MAVSFFVTTLVPSYQINIEEVLVYKRQEKQRRLDLREARKHPVPEMGGTGEFVMS